MVHPFRFESPLPVPLAHQLTNDGPRFRGVPEARTDLAELSDKLEVQRPLRYTSAED